MTVGSRLRKQLHQRMSTRLFPWLIVGVLVALTLPVGLLGMESVAAQYREDPPSCYGIGWGCSLDAETSGFLAAILWGVGTLAFTGVLLLTEFFWKRIAVHDRPAHSSRWDWVLHLCS
jgi:hypothetical protein